jgi:methionine sulfoxide reductase heme-binding subunit
MGHTDWLEISSWLGLTATIGLTVQYLLGMMMGTSYKKSRLWKKIPQRFRRITIYALHNIIARTMLVLICLHAICLLFNSNPSLSITELILPFTGKHQPLVITLGSISLYGALLVFFTSLPVFRIKMGFNKWKKIHLITYCLAPLFILHGLLADPTLKDQQVDWLDGEKLISLGCGVVLIEASFLRYRYQIRYKKRMNKLQLKKSTEKEPVAL